MLHLYNPVFHQNSWSQEKKTELAPTEDMEVYSIQWNKWDFSNYVKTTIWKHHKDIIKMQFLSFHL